VRAISSVGKFFIRPEIEVIGARVFASLRSVRQLMAEKGSRLIRIEEGAFERSKAAEILLPASVQVLGSACFKITQELGLVAFEPESQLVEIGEEAFHSSSVTELVFPAALRLLGKSACYSWKKLTKVTFLGAEIRLLPEKAFAWSGITAVEVPASVEKIAESCFQRAEDLTVVKFALPSKLARIGRKGFAESGVGWRLPATASAIRRQYRTIRVSRETRTGLEIHFQMNHEVFDPTLPKKREWDRTWIVRFLFGN
jgi:hypothetical protein